MASFQGLWTWLWSNVAQWAIIALTVFVLIKEAKSQAWGKFVSGLIIGGLIWYFGTNPTGTLSSISQIFSKIFGG
ncbi:TcpD family membrane protein [Lactococcus lactis]|uniref:TcpD family membrane protein n=1 Tax=Lactococcus lactis TaxID=1358 RepID=UPI0019138E6C|nr:TcpD family membrane protein [Lactococcus lactis]WDA68706.1 TcpD family membrane protein [Lactococcus lactis]